MGPFTSSSIRAISCCSSATGSRATRNPPRSYVAAVGVRTSREVAKGLRGVRGVDDAGDGFENASQSAERLQEEGQSRLLREHEEDESESSANRGLSSEEEEEEEGVNVSSTAATAAGTESKASTVEAAEGIPGVSTSSIDGGHPDDNDDGTIEIDRSEDDVVDDDDDATLVESGLDESHKHGLPFGCLGGVSGGLVGGVQDAELTRLLRLASDFGAELLPLELLSARPPLLSCGLSCSADCERAKERSTRLSAFPLDVVGQSSSSRAM